MWSQRQTSRSSIAASKIFGYQPGPTYGNRFRQDCLASQQPSTKPRSGSTPSTGSTPAGRGRWLTRCASSAPRPRPRTCCPLRTSAPQKPDGDDTLSITADCYSTAGTDAAITALLAYYTSLQVDTLLEDYRTGTAQDAETTSAITAALLAYYTAAQVDALLGDYRTASAQDTQTQAAIVGALLAYRRQLWAARSPSASSRCGSRRTAPAEFARCPQRPASPAPRGPARRCPSARSRTARTCRPFCLSAAPGTSRFAFSSFKKISCAKPARRWPRYSWLSAHLRSTSLLR